MQEYFISVIYNYFYIAYLIKWYLKSAIISEKGGMYGYFTKFIKSGFR